MNGFVCDGQTINMCEKHLKSWKVSRIDETSVQLANCEKGQLKAGDRLLLFVSRAAFPNYGKYEVVTAKLVITKPSEIK